MAGNKTLAIVKPDAFGSSKAGKILAHIEGAGTLNVAVRGAKAKIITDLNVPWGEADSCTSCGKCVQACPTGALFHKGMTVAEMERDRSRLEFIVNAREKKLWIAPD